MPEELSQRDQVRLLISDVGGSSGTDFIFSDVEIETFIELGDGSTQIAAATAMRTIAGNEAMTLKVIDFLELSTDGAKLADSLMKLADKTEEKADDNVDFELVEIGSDFFSRRQIMAQNLGYYPETELL